MTNKHQEMWEEGKGEKEERVGGGGGGKGRGGGGGKESGPINHSSH